MKEPIKVLFICHGNICRSPMAEFILKHMVDTQSLTHHFQIASAATSREEIWNRIGNPVYPPAKQELKKHGISCEGKRAIQVTKQDYEKYDFLIVMDTNNYYNLNRIIGEDKDHKVHMLLDYAGRSGESIADPWYSGNFALTYQEIEAGCKGFLDSLRNGGHLE